MNSDDITPQIATIADRYVYHNPPDLIVQSLNLISRWLQWLQDLLSSIHIPIPLSTDSSVVAYGIWVLLCIFGCASIVLVAYLIVKTVTKKTRQTPLSTAVQIALPNSDDWQEQAKTFSTQEDWRNACRAIYLASLQIISEKKIVSFVPTRTNQEYLHLLHTRHTLQILFAQLIAIVEKSWFGNHLAAESDYQQCTQILNNINANIAEAD